MQVSICFFSGTRHKKKGEQRNWANKVQWLKKCRGCRGYKARTTYIYLWIGPSSWIMSWQKCIAKMSLVKPIKHSEAVPGTSIVYTQDL